MDSAALPRAHGGIKGGVLPLLTRHVDGAATPKFGRKRRLG